MAVQSGLTRGPIEIAPEPGRRIRLDRHLLEYPEALGAPIPRPHHLLHVKVLGSKQIKLLRVERLFEKD